MRRPGSGFSSTIPRDSTASSELARHGPARHARRPCERVYYIVYDSVVPQSDQRIMRPNPDREKGALMTTLARAEPVFSVVIAITALLFSLDATAAPASNKPGTQP